jgi:hypothetical protein
MLKKSNNKCQKIIKCENWRKKIRTIWIFFNKGVQNYMDALNKVKFFSQGLDGRKALLIPYYNWSASQTLRSLGNNCFPYVFHRPNGSYKFWNQCTNDSYKSQKKNSKYLIRFTNALTNIFVWVFNFTILNMAAYLLVLLFMFITWNFSSPQIRINFKNIDRALYI